MIDKSMQVDLDDIYVRKEHCAQHREETSKEFATIKLAVARIETKQNIVVGILAVIATAVVSIAIKALLGG